MDSGRFSFSQTNILYGPDRSGKTAAIEEFLKKHSNHILHTFGAEKGMGIDDVHEVRRRAFISGGQRVQVFCLWRADEMTREATQALLKILEEPPKTSLFFLCTESGELPDTIRSRAARFGFFAEEGTSDAADFFGEEITKRKSEFESFIRREGMVPAEAFGRLSLLVRLSALQHEARINPRYLIDSYMVAF